MRIPSSLYSTDARSNPDIASSTVAPVAASIGKIGRKISNPTPRRPASPSMSASSAIRGKSPDSISARRAIAPGTPAALATASAISPASAPWRSSPVNSRRRKLASGSVARSSSSDSSRLRAARRTAPSRRLHRVDRVVDVGHGQRRFRRRLGLDPIRGRIADPDPALPRDARQERHADPDLVGVQPANSSARIAIFRERELVRATSEEATTTSANSVMSLGSVVGARWRRPPRATRCWSASP